MTNIKTVQVKLDRRKCKACRARVYKIPYKKSDGGMRDLFDAWWPENNVFDHYVQGGAPGAGHCPSPIVDKYLRAFRLKAQKILKAQLSKEEGSLMRGVRTNISNYIRCDKDAPPWCPHRKYHARWAKTTKIEITVEK